MHLGGVDKLIRFLSWWEKDTRDEVISVCESVGKEKNDCVFLFAVQSDLRVGGVIARLRREILI